MSLLVQGLEIALIVVLWSIGINRGKKNDDLRRKLDGSRDEYFKKGRELTQAHKFVLAIGSIQLFCHNHQRYPENVSELEEDERGRESRLFGDEVIVQSKARIDFFRVLDGTHEESANTPNAIYYYYDAALKAARLWATEADGSINHLLDVLFAA